MFMCIFKIFIVYFQNFVCAYVRACICMCVCMFDTFQQRDMKQVLIFSVQTLAALLKCCNANLDRHLTALLSRLLAVIEQIFSWEFAQQLHILYVLMFSRQNTFLLCSRFVSTYVLYFQTCTRVVMYNINENVLFFDF